MGKITNQHVKDYIEELQKEFPDLKIHKKKSWWLNLLFNLPGLKKLKWNNATQCIGMNIWLSDLWDKFHPSSQLSTLRHERQHIIWFKKHTLVFASLLYLLFIFPIGLAYYRARFERAGYKESLRTRVEYSGPTERTKENGLAMYERVFTGWMYLKMWPFPKTIRKWFKEDWEEVVSEVKKNS